MNFIGGNVNAGANTADKAVSRASEISQECKLDLDPDEYVESFKPFSMDITYHWSKVLTAYHMCMIMINDVTLV